MSSSSCLSNADSPGVHPRHSRPTTAVKTCSVTCNTSLCKAHPIGSHPLQLSRGRGVLPPLLFWTMEPILHPRSLGWTGESSWISLWPRAIPLILEPVSHLSYTIGYGLLFWHGTRRNSNFETASILLPNVRYIKEILMAKMKDLEEMKNGKPLRREDEKRVTIEKTRNEQEGQSEIHRELTWLKKRLHN